MLLTRQFKSITCLKNNVDEIVRKLAQDSKPLVITQNGVAQAVLMDVSEYERQMNTIAMLQRLIISSRETAQGLHRSVDEVFDEILRNNIENSK